MSKSEIKKSLEEAFVIVQSLDIKSTENNIRILNSVMNTLRTAFDFFSSDERTEKEAMLDE